MKLGNQLIVPPICPHGPEGVMPDMQEGHFRLYVGGYESGTEVFTVFGESNEDGRYPDAVTTGSLMVASTSPQATIAYSLARSALGIPKGDPGDTLVVTSAETETLEPLRRAFCERVATCRGIVDGECWALGARAVGEALDKIGNR